MNTIQKIGGSYCKHTEKEIKIGKIRFGHLDSKVTVVFKSKDQKRRENERKRITVKMPIKECFVTGCNMSLATN